MVERTRIRNHPERAVPEETSYILTQGIVAHVGFVEDEQPFVIPMTYYYDSANPNSLYLHGSIRSRAMKVVGSGAPVCITVTLTDGLVYSRKAMNHSMNYRSAVVFGRGRAIENAAEKFQLFDRMVQRYFPGRHVSADYNPPAPGDLGVTSLVEVFIEEQSGKARRGGPTGPDDDLTNGFGSAGVIEFREV